jgi:6-phosphogluconolactonase
MHPFSFSEIRTLNTDFVPRAAQAIADAIRTSITNQGRCVLALSGGSTPVPIYAALGNMTDIDWSRVTVIVVDERVVPVTDPRSNQGMIRATLLAGAAASAAVIVPDTSLPLHVCATQYAAAIRPIEKIDIDVCVLGMGDDGHIASLFPPLTDDARGPAVAIPVLSPHPDTRERVTITLPLLATARHSFLLLRGASKLKTWETMLADDADWRRWPMKAVLAEGRTTVVMG